MGSGTRELIGTQDVAFHNPATGTAAQTFSRTTSTGGTTPITKISAQDMPLRDAVVVAGAATPFESLADTAAAKNVETALADIRKNIPHYKNVEHYGMVAGSVSDAVATKNTEVFNQIIADIAASGHTHGVFFPGARYEFFEVSGTALLNIPLSSSLRFLGAGDGTVLAPHASANSGLHIMESIDGNGHAVVDLKFDKLAHLTASCLRFAASTIAIGGFIIERVTASGGDNPIRLIATSTRLGNKYWISKCNVIGGGSYGIAVESFLAGHVTQNILTGTTNLGLRFSCGGGAALHGETEIADNYLLGTTMNIWVDRTGTYNGSNHKGWGIYRNRISLGDITVDGVNEVQIVGNGLANGGINLTMSAIVSAFNMAIKDNQITNGHSNSFDGITVDSVGTSLEGLEISGGRIRNATNHGIRLSLGGPASGVCRYGSIHDVFINNPNRSASNKSGIFLDSAVGMGAQYMNIHHNQIITDTATVPDYGIREANAGPGSNNRNKLSGNIVRGHAVAAFSTTGAQSSQTDSGGADNLNYDEGAGLAP